MNAGKLITNLQAILGMVPNTIRSLSNSEYGWRTIPFSFSGKKYKTDSTAVNVIKRSGLCVTKKEYCQ